MRRKKVNEIILPYEKGLPLRPHVMPGDPIMHAVEIMVEKNLKRITVLHDNRPVGMLRLEDAFSTLGLKMPEPISNGKHY